MFACGNINDRLWVLARIGMLAFALIGCRATTPGSVPTISAPTSSATPWTEDAAPGTPSGTLQPVVMAAPPTVTPLPTSTPTPTLTPLPTPPPSPTATPIVGCKDRVPDDGLLTLVTQEYAVSRHYTPSDLVPLEEYIPADILLGYPIELRRVAAEPLRELINAMHAAELSPTVISGYRSYAAQAIAWKKWVGLEPERVAIISAQPGHSEHQLGTTVDFGSPELEEIVGQPDIEFHTYFYKTGEGVWLAEHAHEFGFVQSYPREALELTGFYYEPWHYRYVGVDLAAELHEAGITLTELLLERHGAPCIP